ncbi:MAG: hypothetical protein QOG70_3293 [Solirubrobacteraceae bacterium]|nr:hypothetical protein [Solirubrobacteraceae bacterium]
MGLRWAIASVAALVAGASFCAPAQAIVGGSPVASIADRPYQVAVVTNIGGGHAAFCGGSIRDARHVITAAHCVFNLAPNPGQAVSPSLVTVVSNTVAYATASPNRRVIGVAAVSFDPGFNDVNLSGDAAVLTTTSDLYTATTDAQPITVQQPQTWQPDSVVNQVASVSGWGATENDPNVQTQLRSVSVPLLSDSNTKCSWFSGYVPAVMLCAGDVNKDACGGDSGGPLVLNQSSGGVTVPTLIGIVSFGPADQAGQPLCGLDAARGVYTEVGSGEIHSYVDSGVWQDAPRSANVPQVTGTLSVGSVVTCDQGNWTGSPTFLYQFVRDPRSDGTAAAALTSPRADPSYTVDGTDAGHTLGCIVTARNGDGYGLTRSGASGLVEVPANAPAAPVAALPPTAPPQQQQDILAPVARITAKRCTATRCTLTVRVTDSGFSAGISTVQASVRSTYRTTCTRKGRKVSCTKRRSRSLRATTLSSSSFRVVAAKLPVGTQLFTLVAVDRAGHRQVLPTRVTLKTKRAKKRR